VGAGFAVRAPVFYLAVGTRVALLAQVFLPSTRAPFMLSLHYAPPRALASALLAPRRARPKCSFSFAPRTPNRVFQENGQRFAFVKPGSVCEARHEALKRDT
jgi:hypothetical protein